MNIYTVGRIYLLLFGRVFYDVRHYTRRYYYKRITSTNPHPLPTFSATRHPLALCLSDIFLESNNTIAPPPHASRSSRAHNVVQRSSILRRFVRSFRLMPSHRVFSSTIFFSEATRTLRYRLRTRTSMINCAGQLCSENNVSRCFSVLIGAVFHRRVDTPDDDVKNLSEVP